MSRDANDLGHILVVDDEEPVHDVPCEYLESQGFGVEAAPDGETALAALGRHRPDLVLLDVRMPGLDGVEVLRRIRHAANGAEHREHQRQPRRGRRRRSAGGCQGMAALQEPR